MLINARNGLWNYLLLVFGFVWTAVKTWTATLVTVADMQTYVSDNTGYLKDKVDMATLLLDKQTPLATNGNLASNTTSEITLYTFSVPGGTLGTIGALLLETVGDFLQTTGGTNTITVRVKFGSTTIASMAFTNVNSAPNRGFWNLKVLLCARAATNAQASKTECWIDPVDASTAAGTAVTKDSVGGAGSTLGTAGGLYSVVNHSSIAEDTTTGKSLAVTVQMSGASASADLRMHAARLWQV